MVVRRLLGIAKQAIGSHHDTKSQGDKHNHDVSKARHISISDIPNIVSNLPFIDLTHICEEVDQYDLGYFVAQGDKENAQRNWRKAAEYYACALCLDPGMGAIWVQLGHSTKELGYRAHALGIYEHALGYEMSKDDALVHYSALRAELEADPSSGYPQSNPQEKATSRPASGSSEEEYIIGGTKSAYDLAWMIDCVKPFFDVEYYLNGFNAADRPANPIEHYFMIGSHQGRQPNPAFSARHYLAMNPDVAAADIDPFLHYCLVGHKEGRPQAGLGRRQGRWAEADVYSAHEYAVAPGPYFEEFDETISIGKAKRAKVLAYYLPQFHPIDINNKQWGKGFTEWRQLPRGMPRFKGHIQPRIPRDLGCYSLDEGDVMRRQVAMARAAGIFGFCFYHYWFDGRRVLETPVERFLKDETIDFPFCLMWANENWTRTWDGSEREIILKQSYRDEDEIPFIDDVARHMKDSRYIRILGRPLFFIYRPGHIPKVKETIARWRALFKERHDLNPLIFNAQAFGDNDPRVFGIDGAIEFPPHKVLHHAPDVKHTMEVFDPNFGGHIPTYKSVVQAAKIDKTTEFPLVRTLFPSWDNDARRPGRGTIVAHSTPELFADWLEWALSEAEANPIYGEKIICINAWNEWAEGAYLEPDVHFGAAYLNTLARVLHVSPASMKANAQKVLLVGHDTMKFGAQILLLNIARSLTRVFGTEVHFLLIAESWKEGLKGDLVDEYKKAGAVTLMPPSSPDLVARLNELRKEGYRCALTNTSVTGSYVKYLKLTGYSVVSLIHELPNLLRGYHLYPHALEIAQNADLIVFPAKIVQDGFAEVVGSIQSEAQVLPQGLYNTAVLEIAHGDNGLRRELGLSDTTKIVLGVGFADIRKGIDRFVNTGLSLCSKDRDLAFIWVGATALEAHAWYVPEIAASGLGDRVRILGHRDDVARFFAAANLFYLSSREDPFPSVVLEALAIGLPVVGHQGCGGCDELIRQYGTLVPKSDPLAVGKAITQLLGDRKNATSKASARRNEILENYDFATYVFALLERLNPEVVKLSAIVPNYNYEAYIGERLRSVFQQTYPLREVIVLDDASPDNSLAQIEMAAQTSGRTISLHVNELNSGSPFRQWRKGVELAKGEYVWIAEADDLADPTFVTKLITQMRAAGSVLGFVDSRQIDENNKRLGDSYQPYLNDIEPNAFDTAFDMKGPEFLARFLSIKNAILNVSGAIVHRQALLDAMDAVGEDLYQYHVAGDWRLYVEICAKPETRVSWLPDALNSHRRHMVSVTHALKIEKHLSEIAEIHQVVGSRAPLSDSILEKQKRHLEACEAHLNSLADSR